MTPYDQGTTIFSVLVPRKVHVDTFSSVMVVHQTPAGPLEHYSLFHACPAPSSDSAEFPFRPDGKDGKFSSLKMIDVAKSPDSRSGKGRLRLC